MIQNSVEASRNASLLAALLQQFREDRHERRRQRRVGEQVGEQVRDLEGDRERRGRPLRAEEAGRDDFAQSPTMREMPVAIEKIAVLRATPPPVGARWGRFLREGFGAGAQGRYSTALRGARPAVRSGAAALSWPTSTRRRSASCAPSASAWRTAATPRRSRRTSAASQTPSKAARAPRRQTHRELVSTIDKAVKRGALHRNTGAHKKSRAARRRAGSSA